MSSSQFQSLTNFNPMQSTLKRTYMTGNMQQNQPQNFPGSEIRKDPSSQIAEIEQKLQRHELETKKSNDLLGEKLQKLAERENTLMHELELQTNENKTLRYNLERIEEEYNYYKIHSTEIEEDYNKMMFNYSNLQIEHEQMKDQFQIVSDELYNAKNKIEQLLYELSCKDNELASLNSLFEQASTELRTAENKLNFSQKEKDNIIGLMNREKDYNSKSESEIQELKNLKSQNKTEIQTLTDKVKNLEKMLNETESETNTLRQIKTHLEENLNEVKLENSKLREENKKYAENMLTYDALKINKEKTEFGYTAEITNLRNDLNSLISVSSENINNLNYFLENYFCTIYSPNVQLPEIAINKNVNENLQFDLLRKNILNAKNKFDNDLNSNISQIKEMKVNLTKGQDENYKLKKFIEDIYQLTINAIEENKLLNLKSNNFNMKDMKEQLEEILVQFFEVAKKLKNDQNEDYVNKILETNTELKNELEEHKTKNEEIIADAFNLEKKIKYLLQEIELKNAQIKSQEEILKRRDIIEENNKKLVKDNVMLINKIKTYQKTGNVEVLYGNNNETNINHSRKNSQHSYNYSNKSNKNFENKKEES